MGPDRGLSMRWSLLLALLAVTVLGCSGDRGHDVGSGEPTWLADLSEIAYPYADETLTQFRELVEGDAWRDPAWNTSGTLEAVHQRTGLVFVLVPAGTFLMGTPKREGMSDRHGRKQEVKLSGFLLCKTECTQRAWDAVGGEDDRYWTGPDLPIETVSWTAATAWCRETGLRLPSESEWEYACRAGTTTCFWSSDEGANLAQLEWYDENAGGRTHAVGEHERPNPWGLHDVHGNVWEWCADLAPASGYRVCRGGCWSYPAWRCGSAEGGRFSPDFRNSRSGVRPAADLAE